MRQNDLSAINKADCCKYCRYKAEKFRLLGNSSIDTVVDADLHSMHRCCCLVCSTELRSFNSTLSNTESIEDWVVCSVAPKVSAATVLQPLSSVVIAKVIESDQIRPFSISLSATARKTLLINDFQYVTVSLLDGRLLPRK